jgi:hypothetical protein
VLHTTKYGFHVNTGLPDFSLYNKPKREKMNQMSTKCPKRSKNRPNGHKIDQHLPLQDPPKNTKTGIFVFENMPSGNPV